jgi:tRNA-specific 2-thiouridylase
MRSRVLIAMSGGVDSSVAAARLLADGLDVIGVTLRLWDQDGARLGQDRPARCHLDDARRVAARLGIAHHVLDRRDVFRDEIVEPFVSSYLRGETPSPCVYCNRQIKLRELLHFADQLCVDTVATGHYARIERVAGVSRLRRARDHRRDQSYFLHALEPRMLARLRFPVGELSKSEVRAQALRLGLPVADKSDSQELCFVPRGSYASFVAARAGDRTRPGPILDAQGYAVGSHCGIHAYTVGQRRRLGVALGRRAYVVALEAATASVRLGTREQTLADGAVLGASSRVDGVFFPLVCEAVVRHRGCRTRAVVSPRHDGGLQVRFDRPVPAVVPGQFVVFYRGDRVLGGGPIRQAIGLGSAAGSRA